MTRIAVLLALIVMFGVEVQAKSRIRFKEVGEKAGIADPGINAAGVAFGDYDNDGDVDIYITTEATAPGLDNRLWENDGTGTFRDVAKERNVDNENGLGRGVSWGDYDNDGDLDLVMGNMRASGSPKAPVPATLYKNLLSETGEPNFENVTVAAGLLRAGNEQDVEDGGMLDTAGGMVFADYNQDGLLDIHWRSADYHVDNELFRNDGDGTFTQVTKQAGISLVGKLLEINSQGSAAWFDFDNDGIIDLLSPTEGDKNTLFHGNGDGTLTDVTLARRPPSGMAFLNPGNANGACVGDIDNDGDMDVYLPLSDQGNRLIRNDTSQGMASFTDITLVSGTDDARGARGCTMADYDNDGLIDIYVNNGGLSNTLINDVMTDMPIFVQFYIAWTPAENVLFQNNGDGTFTDVTARSGTKGFGIGSGVASGDVNDDGFADIFVNNRTYYSGGERANILQTNLLFLNRTNGNNWIKVKLAGSKSNKSALNARAKVVAGDLAQIREVFGATGYNSVNDHVLMFGLGERETVDYIEVVWPSGATQRVNDPAPRGTIVITEPAD